MVETKITGSQAIEIIGKEIYGDEFSLSNEKTKKVYKLVYEVFKKSFLGKKNLKSQVVWLTKKIF